MTPIHPQAHYKAAIVAALREYVYVPAAEMQRKQLDALVDSNAVLSGNCSFFRYGGEVYRHSEAPRIEPRIVPALRPVFRERMREYLAIRAALEKRMYAAMGALIPLWNASSSLEDYLAVLPDSLHPPLLGFRHMGPGEACFSPGDIKKMQERIAPGIDLLRQQLVLNLLV